MAILITPEMANREEQLTRLGARAAARDVIDYINDQLTNDGQLDVNKLRAWLFAYWISLGAFDGNEDSEDLVNE